MQNFMKKLALFGIVALSGLQTFAKEIIDPTTDVIYTREDQEKGETLAQDVINALDALDLAQNEVEACRNSEYYSLIDAFSKLKYTKKAVENAYELCSKNSICSQNVDDYLQRKRYLGLIPGYVSGSVRKY